MRRLVFLSLLLLPCGLFAGNRPVNDGNELTVFSDSTGCPEVLVVVYDVTGNENYSKVRVVSLDENHLTAVDPESRLADGVYLIIATSNQAIYRQTLVIDHDAASCSKTE